MIAEPILHGGSDRNGNPVGLGLSGIHDNESFSETLAMARVEDVFDMGGFKLYVGFDEHGQVAYFIQNGLRDGQHLIISTPLTAPEWQQRAGC